MPKPKYLSENGLLYLWQRIGAIFATKSEVGDENIIETVKVNNTALTPDADKAVNIDLSGKADVATTLAGYGITNAYTKTETDAAITDAIGEVTGLSFEVVQTLPASGEAGRIYLKPNSGSGTNIYDEYIYYNNAWEMIGSTAVDLSNYINVNDELTNAEIAEIIGS